MDQTREKDNCCRRHTTFCEEGEVGEGFKRYDRWLNDVARRNAHYEEVYQECVIPSHCWIIHKEDFDAVEILIL